MILQFIKKFHYSNGKEKKLINIKYLNALIVWESSVKTLKRYFVFLIYGKYASTLNSYKLINTFQILYKKNKRKN